jgi:hypothetical protein
MLAFTADNACFLWDCQNSKVKATFMLQSSGVGLSFHRDEKNKVSFFFFFLDKIKFFTDTQTQIQTHKNKKKANQKSFFK